MKLEKFVPTLFKWMFDAENTLPDEMSRLHVIDECHRCRYWLQETEDGHGLCEVAKDHPEQTMGSDTKETYYNFGCIEWEKKDI